jgi:hypothetical protein
MTTKELSEFFNVEEKEIIKLLSIYNLNTRGFALSKEEIIEIKKETDINENKIIGMLIVNYNEKTRNDLIQKEYFDEDIILLKKQSHNHDYSNIEKLIEANQKKIDEITNATINKFNFKEEIKEKDEIGFIYIIKDISKENIYKIGKTKYLQERLNALSTGNPNLEIIATKQTSKFHILERKIHKYYKANRIKGEWFKLSDIELQYIIKRLNFLLAI